MEDTTQQPLLKKGKWMEKDREYGVCKNCNFDIGNCENCGNTINDNVCKFFICVKQDETHHYCSKSCCDEYEETGETQQEAYDRLGEPEEIESATQTSIKKTKTFTYWQWFAIIIGAVAFYLLISIDALRGALLRMLGMG